MGKMISNAITDFFSSIAGSIMDGILGICKGIIDNVQKNIGIVDKWYDIFLGFSTSLIIVVMIGRCLSAMSDVGASDDVSVSRILIDALKASIAMPLMVFFQGFLQKQAIFPILKYIFSINKSFTVKAVKNVGKSMPGGYQLSAIMVLFLLIFFAVVMCFFFVKMCIYYVEMMWFNITIPLVAVSMATETFDYSSTWCKKLIYYNLTVLLQVLSLTLMVSCFTQINKGIWYLMASIGFGVTTIRAPFVIDQLWASTGVAKAGVRSMTRAGGRMISGMFK